MKVYNVCLFSWFCIGIVKSNISEIIPFILDEFHIHQPIVLNYLLDTTDFTKIVKNLSYQGQRSCFNHNPRSNYYQSYVIFTDLSNSKWNPKTCAPILVISNIENEVDLKNVEVSIGSEILFLDLVSLKVYETYRVNEIHIIRYLGQFQRYDSLKEVQRFLPEDDYIPSMEKRRTNFHGLQINSGLINLLEDPGVLYPDDVQFFPNNDTYDVSNLVGNPKFNAIFNPFQIPALRLLRILESKLNFTAKVFLRKDMKLGSPQISSNGSAVIAEGLFQNLGDGSIDLLPTFLVMLPERAEFGDFLPAMLHYHDTILIPIEDSTEDFDWNAFLDPFSYELWIAIIFKCIVFSIIAFIIEWFHNYKLVHFSLIYKIWASFTPNFGGTPFESKTDHLASYKTMLYITILDGLVIWISYQSFLYSELSTPHTKNPFHDLESLSNSQYKLYTGKKDSYISNVLSTPLYKSVKENNVDLESSFNVFKISINKTLTEPKSALFAYSFLEHCKLKSAWKSTSAMHASYIMRKQSEFTRIFGRAMLDMKEGGLIDLIVEKYRHRCTTSENSNTMNTSKKPLGYEKLSLLFLVLISGYILSLSVIFCEWIAQKIQKKHNSVSKDRDLKLTIIAEEIEENLRGLSTEETENILHRILQRHMNV